VTVCCVLGLDLHCVFNSIHAAHEWQDNTGLAWRMLDLPLLRSVVFIPYFNCHTRHGVRPRITARESKCCISLLRCLNPPLIFAGEEGQQGTLAKSLLTSSLLCQGTAIISQDAIQEPSLARFVATVVHFRKTYASLLQPAHFTSSRELRWHGATTGQIPAL